jgi:hypothetical protein
LSGCHLITDASILKIAEKYPNLQKLFLVFCDNITEKAKEKIRENCLNLEGLYWCFVVISLRRPENKLQKIAQSWRIFIDDDIEYCYLFTITIVIELYKYVYYKIHAVTLSY